MERNDKDKRHDISEPLLHEGSFQFTDEAYAKVLANYNRDVCHSNIPRLYDPNMASNFNFNIVKVEELLLDNQVSISLAPQCNTAITFTDFTPTLQTTQKRQEPSQPPQQHPPQHQQPSNIAEVTPVSSNNQINNKETTNMEAPIERPVSKVEAVKAEPKNLLKSDVDMQQAILKSPRTPNFKHYIYHNPLEYYHNLMTKKSLEFKDCNLEATKDYIIHLPEPVDESSSTKRVGSYECLVCKPSKKVRFFVSKNGAMITTNVMNHLNRHFQYKDDKSY